MERAYPAPAQRVSSRDLSQGCALVAPDGGRGSRSKHPFERVPHPDQAPPGEPVAMMRWGRRGEDGQTVYIKTV